MEYGRDQIVGSLVRSRGSSRSILFNTHLSTLFLVNEILNFDFRAGIDYV
jgi:hypothetical protein